MTALNQANIDQYNNFINGNASEDTLNILANSQYFTKYYKEVSADETNINVVKSVSDIYNAMFNDQEQAVLKISDQCVIDFPSRYKKRLIDACSLLSPKTKLD